MKRTTRWAALAAAALTAATTFVAVPAQAASSHVAWANAKVVRWIDGDTVVTTRGTVRLIGVDTPEQGACGERAATAYAKQLAPVGSIIKLGNPRSVRDRDKYDRNLRYVDRGTADIANKLIAKGAKARYDGRDGYQWHPRQTKYRNTDSRYRNYTCGPPTPAPVVAPQPTPVPEPTPMPPVNTYQERANQPVSGTNPDLDCGDIPTEYKPIQITGPDYHRLDADGDGWGCES